MNPNYRELANAARLLKDGVENILKNYPSIEKSNEVKMLVPNKWLAEQLTTTVQLANFFETLDTNCFTTEENKEIYKRITEIIK